MAGKKRADRKSRSQKRHIGAYVAEELSARQWTERRFGIEADLSGKEVRALLSGEVLTSAAAAGLARAFGGEAETWMELETDFRQRELMQFGQKGYW